MCQDPSGQRRPSTRVQSPSGSVRGDRVVPGPECPILFSFSIKSLGGLVSVRVGLKGTGIDDSLVVHQLVTLVVGIGVEIVGFGVTHDLVRFDHLGFGAVPFEAFGFRRARSDA